MAEVSGTASTSAGPFTRRAPNGASREDTRLAKRYAVVVPHGEGAARPANTPIIGDLRIHSKSRNGAVHIGVMIVNAKMLQVIRTIIVSQGSRRRGLSDTPDSLLPQVAGLPGSHDGVVLQPSQNPRPWRWKGDDMLVVEARHRGCVNGRRHTVEKPSTVTSRENPRRAPPTGRSRATLANHCTA
jgi:hypothetical protein